MDKISFDEFQKVELRIGKILNSQKIEKSDKLLKLEVDFGEERRQVVSGIAQSYSIDDLTGQEFLFITNLEPRTIMGLESQAMILAVEKENKAVCLVPTEEVEPGAKLR
jgi:methionyl-tRNA synthetase